MVNPNSPAFNFAEKVGFFIGKSVRYIIICGIVFIIGGKLRGSKTPGPVPNQPASPTPPSP